MKKQPKDPESLAALEVVEMEKRQRELQETERENRENAIINIFELAGKVKGASFNGAQARFFKLMFLKQVKDSKGYREQFGMTWQKFCDHVGVDRRRVDEQLADLKPFAQEFLAEFANFTGHEVNKIRVLGQAVSGGSAKIKDNALVYGDEVIPLTPEYRDDIRALLETIQEDLQKQVSEYKSTIKAKDRLLKDKDKHGEKLVKELERLSKHAKDKDLSPEEDAFLHQMENLRIGFDGYMLKVDPERMEALRNNGGNPPTKRMLAAYLTTLRYMYMQMKAAHDTAIDFYGDPALLPSQDDWQPKPTRRKK